MTQNERIINHWSFIGFAEQFGKVVNRQTRTPENGDPFETLSFRHSREDNDPHAAKYVHFSSKLPYMSNKDLKEQMNDLQVIEWETSPEVAAARAEKGYQVETYILCRQGQVDFGEEVDLF